jgi:putative ABC transport system substrate-binding protein
MRRREFIALLGGAAAATASELRAARAGNPPLPVVAALRSTSSADSTLLVAALKQGVTDSGFVEGQSVAFAFRYAENKADRLPDLAASLIRQPVAVIVGDPAAIHAAMATTKAVPLLFAIGGDPVADRLVANLNRPGGNVTGVVFFSSQLGAKRIDLLRQLVPSSASMALLIYPNSPERRRNEATS